MDISLLKTFLEVSATGSFVAASERLFVTQSAVSLRIQRLETELGKPVFVRSKAGAELTAAGREFERYALSIIKIWEEARQQVAIPKGFTKSLSIGAQYSLWPRLGFRMIDRMREAMPELNIRAELGMPDRLTRLLVEGVVQMAFLYMPQLRPGLVATKVMNEELVLVAPWENPTLDLQGRYLFVDWGTEFVHKHSLLLPDLTNPGLTFSLGALTAQFIFKRNFAAYLPARYVRRYLDEGRLHLVSDAPRFPYPIWLVWREDIDKTVAEAAHKSLIKVTEFADAEQHSVMDRLELLNHPPKQGLEGGSEGHE